MMNTLTLLLVALFLPCCTGGSMEAIPSSSVVKKPGETLSLSCRGSGFSFGCCSMHWIRQPDGKTLEWIGRIYNDASKTEYASSVQGRIEITRDNSNSMVYLSLSNLKPEDSAVYYCAKRAGGYGFDYWGKGTTVTVTSATQSAPTVFPLMQCGSGTGDTVTLGCLATGFTPSSLTYSWSKVNGAALTDFIQYPPVLKDNLYTGVSQVRVSRQDLDSKASFRCDVTHAAGNKHVIITPGPPVTPVPPVPTPTEVYHKLPTLKVLTSSDEGSETFLSCLAKDFSPKDFEFKWLKNNAEITDGIHKTETSFDEKKTDNGTLYSAASFLTVPHIDSENIEFTCEFTGNGENGATHVNSSVIYKPTTTDCKDDTKYVDMEIIGPTVEDLFVHGKGTVECHVTIYKPSVQKIFWRTDTGDEIPGTTQDHQLEGKLGLVTSFLPITFEEWRDGTQFVCVVEHENLLEPLKETYKRMTGGPPQRPSVFMLPPLEHTKAETVTLICFVKDFFPKEVFVSWLVDDEEADSKYKSHTTEPVENGQLYSAYGQLTIPLEQWKNDDTVFSCAVHHESVFNTTKAIVRSIGHRTFEKNNIINLSMNVPETCKA